TTTAPRRWTRPMASTKTPTLTAAHVKVVEDTLVRAGVREDLDEAVGRTFVRVIASFHLYDPARPLEPWLRGFARLQALNSHRRMRQRCRREVLIDDVDRLPPEPSETGDLGERVADAIRLVDELPEIERTAFLLHEGTGLTMREIACVMGCSKSTV